jgi:hypothetical protein
MLIDRLQKMAEANTNGPLAPLAAKVIQEATLFRIDKATTRKIHESLMPGRMLVLNNSDIEQFHLPFDEMSFEFGADSRHELGKSCVVLVRKPIAPLRFSFTGLTRESDSKGSVGFVFCGFMEVNPSPQENNLSSVLQGGNLTAGILRDDVFVDVLNDLSRNDDKNILWKCTDGSQRSSEEIFESDSLTPVSTDAWKRHYAYGNCMSILRMVFLSILRINSPTEFIVEEQPVKWKGSKPARGRMNSTKKPHFIVLAPERIRKRYVPHELTDEEKAQAKSERKPHHRRGHWRSYRSERYRNMKGKRKWIEAIWVGPREAVQGKNRYIVRTDL